MQSPSHLSQLNLPAGFQSRPAQLEDAAAISDLFNAHSMAQYGVRDMTPERMLSELSIPNFDPADQTMLLISPDGQIIGYCDVDDTEELPVHPYVWSCIHPDYEHSDLLRTMLEWALERARKAIARVPEDVRVALKTGVNSQHDYARRVLESMDMVYNRNWWTMRIEAPDSPSEAPKLPGFSIRSMRYPEELDAVLMADMEAFRDHWGFMDRSLEEGRSEVEHNIAKDPNFDISLWFVAVDDETGEIAATSLCRLDRRDEAIYGRIQHLSVRRNWRKRGLGMVMLQHSFSVFWERGYAGATLGVDATNLTGATRLYERAGMYKERHSVSYELELRPGRELTTTDILSE